jgi:hypothetical protein
MTMRSWLDDALSSSSAMFSRENSLSRTELSLRLAGSILKSVLSPCGLSTTPVKANGPFAKVRLGLVRLPYTNEVGHPPWLTGRPSGGAPNAGCPS